MSRLTMASLAAAAAAIATAAVLALPAIGNSPKKDVRSGPGARSLTACLAAHGLPGAPTTAVDLKRWIAGREKEDPRGVTAALRDCTGSVPGAAARGPDIARSIACVRRRGIDAPAAPADFKRWIAAHQHGAGSQALHDALVACKLAPGPHDKGATGK